MYESKVGFINSNEEKTPITHLGTNTSIDAFDKMDSSINKPMSGMNFWGEGAHKDDFTF